MTEQKAASAKKTTGSPFVKKESTPETQPATMEPGDPASLDAIQKERDQKLQEKVDASTVPAAAPEDQQGPIGGSFYNPATVGSGTILPDGTYGNPLPDPNVARLAEDAKDSDNQ